MAGAVRIAFLADVGKAKLAISEVAKTTSSTVGKTTQAWSKLKDRLKLGGLAAGAALGAALTEALDVGAAKDKLSAQLGLTGAVSEKFGRAAGNLYKNAYGESVSDTGDVIKAAFENGLVSVKSSQKAIEDVGAAIFDYTTLTGGDALEATRAVSQMIKTGLAKNAKQAFDILTRGQQLGINKSEDLLDTFNEYGTQFRKIGLDGPKALGLLRQGLQGGARDSDLVADAIKEFSIRAVDGSKTTVDAFKRLGLSADTMQQVFAKGGPKAAEGLDTVLDKLRAVKDPAERAKIAVELFGTQAEDMGEALFKLDPSTAVAGLGKLDGAAKRAGETLNDNAKTRITAFTRSLKMGVVDFLGAKVIPALDAWGQSLARSGPRLGALGKQVRSDLGPAVKELRQLWLDNRDNIKLMADSTIGLASAVSKTLGPALRTTLPLLRSIASIDMSRTAAAVASLNNLLKGTNDNGAASSLKDKLIQAGTVANSVNLPGKIAGIATDAIFAFTSRFKNDSSFRGASLSFMRKAATWLVSATPLGTAAQAGRALASKLGDGLMGSSGSTRGRVSKFMSNVGNFISWATPSGIATSMGKRLASRLGDGIMGSSGTVRGRVSTFMGNVGKYLSWATPAGAAANVGRGLGVKLAGAIPGGINAAFGAVRSLIGGLPGRIARSGGNWGGALVGAGRAVIGGLVSGIRGAIPSVSSVLGRVTSMIPNWKGPAQRDKRLLTPAGKLIMQGLVEGINRQLPDLKRTLTGVSGLIEGGLSASPSVVLAGAVAGTGRVLGAAATPVVVNVYALTSGPEVGRQVVDAISQYETFNGASWRTA